MFLGQHMNKNEPFWNPHPGSANKSRFWGYKKGVFGNRIAKEYLAEEGLSLKSVKAITSIDKKADETAFLELSKKYDWPFITYKAEELDVVEGIENPSEVVKKFVGTRSVAEAACLLNSTAIKLLMPKKAHTLSEAGKNMTVAIARIPFEKRKV